MLMPPKDFFAFCAGKRCMAGAFNVFNFESLQAVIWAAEAEASPAILQVSSGAERYVRNIRRFLGILTGFADEASVPLMIQRDHCLTLDECIAAMDAGFPALMFDCSHFALPENIKKTAELTALARKRGVWVEAELGRLPGFEDTVFSGTNVFTDPKSAADFVRDTNCDALAVAVGTSHGGVISDQSLPLDFTRLEAIHNGLPGVPLVLHGGASLPLELINALNSQGGKALNFRNVSESDIARCAALGVRKVNMDVDNFMVFTTAVRRVLNEQPEKYDPRIYLERGREAFEKEVRHKMRTVLVSSGKASRD